MRLLVPDILKLGVLVVLDLVRPLLQEDSQQILASSIRLEI